MANFLKARGAWDNKPTTVSSYVGADAAKPAAKKPKLDAKVLNSYVGKKVAEEAKVKIHQPGYNPPPAELISSADDLPSGEMTAPILGGKKSLDKIKEAMLKPELAKGFPARGVRTGVGAPKGTSTMPKDKKKAAGQPAGAPFEPDPKPSKPVTAGKHGEGYSRARHLARKGLQQMLQINPKIAEGWSDAALDQLSEVHPAVMAMAKVAGNQSLKAQADKHTQMALQANKAGDDEKVKFHQAQVAKIKAKMQKEETVNELKASTLQSYADKAHQQALDATYDAAHLNRSGEEQLKANAKKLAAKRAGGVQRAQTKLDKMSEEMADQAPMQLAHGLGDLVTCKRTQRLATVVAAEGDKYTVVYADGSTETGDADWWTPTRKITEARVVEQPRGWNVRHLKPAGHGIVGKKVRSYDFPGFHDSHYVEGHVTDEDPNSYHIRTTKVVRHNKEEPIPAHLTHIRAPKGLHIFGNAQGVYYAPKEVKAKPVTKKSLGSLRSKR